MRVRKLKKQEIRAVMPLRHNGFPGVLVVGAMAVIIAIMMILAATPGLAEIVGGWGDAELIETGDGAASYPQIATDGDGNAIAVWNQEEGDRGDIWSNRYVVGVGWSEAQLIETGDGAASYPQVATDGDGNAIAVWQQDDPIASIYSNRYVVGVGWCVAQPIETEDRYAYYPQVAMDGDGNAIAVWEQWDGAKMNIWSNRYIAEVGWGDSQIIGLDPIMPAGDAQIPQVAMNDDGSAIAVWHVWMGSRTVIWSNQYIAGVGWGEPQDIETLDGSGSAPQVAMDGGGNAIAIWEQSDGTGKSIWSNRYSVGVGWGDVQLIEAYDEYGYLFEARVAMDGDGNAIAVWRYVYGTQQGIWSNRYVVGIGWGDPEPVDVAGESAYSPQIAVDRGGNAIAVWGQWDGYNSIWSNRYVVGVGWGNAQPIEAESGYSSYPQVAVDGGGNAIAVWCQWDGAQPSIWSNRYTVSVDGHQFRHCNGNLEWSTPIP